MASDLNEELREASCNGNLEHVQKLIKCGAAVNSRNKMNGWTPMHWACKRGHEQVVAMLLGAGANPNILNEKGEHPASLTSNSKIHRMLHYTDDGTGGSSGGGVMPRYSNSKSASSDGESSPGFVPNYLRFPSFPYTSKEVPASQTNPISSSDGESKRGSRRSHHGSIPPPPPPPPQRQHQSSSSHQHQSSSHHQSGHQSGHHHHHHRQQQPSQQQPSHHHQQSQSIQESPVTKVSQSTRNGHEPVAIVNAPSLDMATSMTASQHFGSGHHHPQPIRIARANLVTRSTQTNASDDSSSGGSGGCQSPLILKVRLAECSRSDKWDADFYEVELDRTGPLTLEQLLNSICSELEIQPCTVRRIRKLPDVVVRKDADVRRLVDGQHIELVLL